MHHRLLQTLFLLQNPNLMTGESEEEAVDVTEVEEAEEVAEEVVVEVPRGKTTEKSLPKFVCPPCYPSVNLSIYPMQPIGSKETRTAFHQVIRELFAGKLDSETDKSAPTTDVGSRIVVKWSRRGVGRGGRERKGKQLTFLISTV